MTIRDILLHMAPDAGRQVRLAVAVDLARRFQARLDIVYLTAPVSMPAAITGRGASYAYLAEATAINEEKAEGIAAEVAEVCRQAGIAWQWEVASGDQNEYLAERSISADLVIVHEHHGATAEDHVNLVEPTELIMTAACPVLVLPAAMTRRPVGEVILVAWKDTKEAARAVRDAAPFLDKATKVYVLTCEEPRYSVEQGRALVERLKGRGIDVEALNSTEGGNVGEIILRHAEDLKADLLVMGAFGHSPLREWILGGVTNHVLRNLSLPLLTSR